MESPAELKKSLQARGADVEFFKVYENVYNQIHYMINNGGLDLNNLDELIKSTMEAVEAVAELKEEKISGTRKMELAKSVIVQVISHIGEQGNMDSDLSKKIVLAINTIGPTMFKLIIMADKGQFNLNNVKQVVVNAAKGCCVIV